ncbi:MAG: haloacid dehalogenase type II [Chloroflexi bacterium]|nr:haloacid dehalogenase type II [Chloroflexota bacterium]
MTNDPLASVTTAMFDFYGTVVDMQRGLTEAIAPYLQAKGSSLDPGRVVTWWRRTHFEASMIDALLHREHTPYRQIGFQAVDYTLERAGIPHTPDEVAALVSAIERLKPFPDVVAALSLLKQHGLKLVILSNGDPDMLERGVAYSGTAHLFDHVISVAEAGSFKPHVATYRTACERVHVRPEQVAFVANHTFDCVGAKAFGMRAVFVDRRKRPFGNTTYPPDLIVADFQELASRLTGAG